METITIRVPTNHIKKSDLIRGYIEAYNPRRKDLTRFIVVNINGLCKVKDFDNYRWRGYWAVNLKKMRDAGNVEIIDGRYYVTEQGKKLHNHSLYYKPDSLKLKELKAENKRLRQSNADRRNDNNELWNKIRKLKETLNFALDEVSE